MAGERRRRGRREHQETSKSRLHVIPSHAQHDMHSRPLPRPAENSHHHGAWEKPVAAHTNGHAQTDTHTASARQESCRGCNFKGLPSRMRARSAQRNATGALFFITTLLFPFAPTNASPRNIILENSSTCMKKLGLFWLVSRSPPTNTSFVAPTEACIDSKSRHRLPQDVSPSLVLACRW